MSKTSESQSSAGSANEREKSAASAESTLVKAAPKRLGMLVDQRRCIGCHSCSIACKSENNVPLGYWRSWVKGIQKGGFPHAGNLYLRRLCNHCDVAPCVQVCPVGATFTTEDGVVLVDEDYCIGCRYCIQACPYGARFLHPVTRTAEKCTFCYHRISQGLKPACVELCPTEARLFGRIGLRSSPLSRFTRFNKIQVLKPELNTEPKVYYADLDGVVR